MSWPRNSRFRTVVMLGVVGASGVVALLFSPARDHGVIDVVSTAAASSAYAGITASIALTEPPCLVTR